MPAPAQQTPPLTTAFTTGRGLSAAAGDKTADPPRAAVSTPGPVRWRRSMPRNTATRRRNGDTSLLVSTSGTADSAGKKPSSAALWERVVTARPDPEVAGLSRDEYSAKVWPV